MGKSRKGQACPDADDSEQVLDRGFSCDTLKSRKGNIADFFNRILIVLTTTGAYRKIILQSFLRTRFRWQCQKQ